MGENFFNRQIEPDSAESAAGYEYLDAPWYARLKEEGGFTVYTRLGGDKDYRQAQKELFLDGEIQNPVLDYPSLDMYELRDHEARLITLKSDILAGEPNPVIRQAYRWNLNERLAKNRLLQAAATGDMVRFKRYNDFIYGQPDAQVFGFTVAELTKFADRHLDSGNEPIVAASARLLELLPRSVQATSRITEPGQETFTKVREITVEEFQEYLEGIEISDKAAPREIKDILDRILPKISKDWAARYRDDGLKTYGVDQSGHAVLVPPDGVTLRRDRILGLPINHEVFTHVLRRMNGERSKLGLLSMGLDRNELADEGLGILREQTVYENMEEFKQIKRYSDILERHLAVGLAYGLDGRPRDFREVYDVIYAYEYLRRLVRRKDTPDVSKVQETAQNSAWSLSVRVLKGTAPNSRGVAYTRNMIYLPGNLALWQLLSKHPEAAKRFNIGKYDPTNPRHIWILEELGVFPKRITEENLKELG